MSLRGIDVLCIVGKICAEVTEVLIEVEEVDFRSGRGFVDEISL